MTDPVFYGKPLTFSAKAHRYAWDGQHVPSVTTIINQLSKPLLIQWAANCAVEHLEARVKSGELRPRTGDGVALTALDMQLFEAACADARKAHLTKRDDAGDVGRIVHSLAVDLQSRKPLDLTKLPPGAPTEQITNALRALQQWFDTTKLGMADLERRVFSREGMYAGTTDRWGVIGNHMAVLDFKTGGGVYDEAWFQTAGYEMALREELGIKEPIWHYVIHLDKNTGQCVPYVRGPAETGPALEVWRSLVRLDKAMRAMPKMRRAA